MQSQDCLEQLHVPLSAVNAGECQMAPSALPVSLTVCHICLQGFGLQQYWVVTVSFALPFQ